MPTVTPATPAGRERRRRRAVAAAFLLPSLVLLGALVVHPIGYSVYRSLYDRSGDSFAGLANYAELWHDEAIRTALRNTALWAVLAPSVATALGLVFAVLTERVRWGTAFKLVVFMPMAISMLAAGIVFRLVYEQDPDRGVANAVLVGVHDTFAPASAFPKARPGRDSPLRAEPGGGYITADPVRAGVPALLPLVGVAPDVLPEGTRPARPAAADPGRVTGTAWQDFARGGGAGRAPWTRANRGTRACGWRPCATAGWWTPRGPARTAPSPCRRRRTARCCGCPPPTSRSRTRAWPGWARRWSPRR